MTPASLLAPELRADFPLLGRQHVPGRPLVYLDSAATSLKPRPVIQAVADTMGLHSANVHRAVHLLGDEATELFEGARRKVARLIGAEAHEVVLVRNATEGINLVARCYPRRGRVLVSLGEHHSNLLPWGPPSAPRKIEDRKKMLRDPRSSIFDPRSSVEGEVTWVPPRPDGSPDLEALLRELARGGVAVVAAASVSNVAGGRLDVRRLAGAAHAAGAVLVLDGAQAIPHTPTDVLELDCDFLAFSAHKMCGPSGVGVLYGKAERLAELDDYLQGGGTVEQVVQGTPQPKQPPWRFEAGTPPIEAVVGLGAAVDYLQTIGLEDVQAHVRLLYRQARERLRAVPGARLLGPQDPADGHAGPLSFVVANTPSHLIARALSDGHGICVRSGFHCAQPLHEHLGWPPTVRLSFYLYNQPWEIDLVFETLAQILAHGRRLT
jgi:cysteine desulfurase/selenocysteine lyase